MCGIAGFVSLTGRPSDSRRLAGMVKTLRHRGPDDQGLFTEGPAALGAARLSVIDVAGGHQPISIDGGAVTVVQNGEIYNYVELRDELARAGRHFATTCDTEVIAHLYATEGLAGFRRMRGMFAVAIWDAPHQRLVLARDRVGKKPLYVIEHRGEWLFGSETKAVLAALDQVPSVNPSALLTYFTFGYVSGSDAVFQGMRRLEPGTAMTIDARAGSATVERFWSWPDGSVTDTRAEDEVIEELRAELDEAVRIRLRSDVPLGAFLSGGMDSAAVLALMARHSTRPVQTFTIGFGDPAYDELDEARSTAAAFGADHHEQIVMPDGVGVAEVLAIHYDEPFADASAIPTYYVSELARRHVTVCLSGDGGDELFAGYTPYADALARVGAPGVGLLRSAIGAGARMVPVHARGKGRLSTMGLGPEGWFVWRRTVFPDYLLEAVAGPDLVAAAVLPEWEAVDQISDATGPLLSRLQRWDQRHYLPDDILVKVDRATMAHSLEARCPLLDQRVIEIAAAQPAGRHGDAETTKRLFRKVIEPWVPADVLRRPKRGFGVPLRRWFHEGLIGWARDILVDPRARQRGWTRSSEVAALLRQHEQGRRDHAKRIWALVCLELWARQHLDRSPLGRSRMRVTMLVRCLAMMRGGGETRHLAWMRELTALGVEVDVITGQPLLVGGPRHPVSDLQATMVRSPYLRDAVYRWQHQRGFGRLTMTALHLDEEWFCRSAWRRIAERSHPPDIVHAHALYQAARLRRNRISVVINFPGAPNARYLADIRAADALIGDGWAAANLPSMLGRPVHAVPKGVDAQLFRPDGPSKRRELGLDGRRVVLSVGRFVPIKNMALLIDAAARLRPSEPALHVLLVGEGPEQQALRQQVARLGLGGAVTFAGDVPQDHMGQDYRAADVFALASDFDNSPNVVLEAMACGLPVVATDVGGVSEYVMAGRGGTLVARGDAGMMAWVVGGWLSDAGRRREAGVFNRQRALERFSWRASAQRLLEVYREVVDRRTTAARVSA